MKWKSFWKKNGKLIRCKVIYLFHCNLNSLLPFPTIHNSVKWSKQSQSYIPTKNHMQKSVFPNYLKLWVSSWSDSSALKACCPYNWKQYTIIMKNNLDYCISYSLIQRSSNWDLVRSLLETGQCKQWVSAWSFIYTCAGSRFPLWNQSTKALTYLDTNLSSIEI